MNQQNPWAQTAPQSQVPPQPQSSFPPAPGPQGAWGPPPQPVVQSHPPQSYPATQASPSPEPRQLPLFPPEGVAPTQTQQSPAPADMAGEAVTPPVSEQPPTPATAATVEIMQLLKEFAKRENCDRYSADGEKIKLITDYLWLRQLTPTLLFETFLDLYAVVADYDAENLKHPADAIKELLPRAKSVAEKKGSRQWKAGEVVDFLSLYIDMVRAAELSNTPVPMTLNQFLVDQHILNLFLSGALKSTGAPAAKTEKSRATAKPKEKPAQAVRPTAAGQRVLMTDHTNRQYRGITQAVWTDNEGTESARSYVDFKADSGEEFKGVSVLKFEVIDDPLPQPVIDDATEQPKPELSVASLTIKKAEYGPACQCLALDQPVGTVAIGDNVYNWHQHFADGRTAVICVVNGERKPYVDAFLCEGTPDNVLAEVQPRDNLAGTYQFDTAAGVYTLEVKGNE